MKAVVCTKYGPPDVLRLHEVAKPAPGTGEVLIEVHAATATTAGLLGRKGEPRFSRLFTGLRRPRKAILGTEFAGEIAEVGEAVTRFRPGDRIFGHAGLGTGTYAEFIRLPEDAALVRKPDRLTYEEAAAVIEGGLTALHFFRDRGAIRPGDEVLINGASGAVGTAAVQLAKHLGAHVTGVCSAANVDLVASLGADEVIDYTREDFTANGRRYRIVFDAVGKSSFARCRNSLTRDGVYLDAGKASTVLPMLWTSLFGRRKAVLKATYVRSSRAIAADLLVLRDLIEAGAIRPVIDRCYPLAETAEAHRYVETGRKKGNVIITL